MSYTHLGIELPGAVVALPPGPGPSAGTAPPVFPGLRLDPSAAARIPVDFSRTPGGNPFVPPVVTDGGVTEAGLLGLSWKTWLLMSGVGLVLVLVFRRRSAPRENPRRRRSRRSRR